MIGFDTPLFPMACSRASMIHPALGPSRGNAHTTLPEKWSMATRTWIVHRPQHRTFVLSTDQTWLEYQAGIERASGFSSGFSVVADGAVGVFRGFGLCRMFRTVEAARKLPTTFG